MTEPEKQTIVGIRAGELRAHPVLGGIRERCALCGHEVYLNPSARELAYTEVLCMGCAQATGNREDPWPLTEAQRLEIARQTGLHNDGLDRLWRRAVDHFRRGGTDD